MNIVKSTAAFEQWLGKLTQLLPDDLHSKHEQMADRPFAFLRATFYRWMQRWPQEGKRWADAPIAPSVGDLHVENFGTWRDAEGRLAWGVNDFDEAYDLPFTTDLVRLATSAALAAGSDRLGMSIGELCDAILDGYAVGVAEPSPFVLAERHSWLATLAAEELRNPARYWAKMEQWPSVPFPKTKPGTEAVAALHALLPQPVAESKAYRLVRRTAGLGSLGKIRLVALAHWQGATIAREAKALTTSACVWADGKPASKAKINYDRIMNGSVRCADPLVIAKNGWVVRRLAPDCGKIDIASLAHAGDVGRLISAMGRETANIHAAADKGTIKDIRRDLKSRGHRWLAKAAETMAGVVHQDWGDWRAAMAKNRGSRLV
jgi:hypothetical protein